MIIKIKCRYDKTKDEYVLVSSKLLIPKTKSTDSCISNNRNIIKQIFYISLAVIMTIAMIEYKLNIPIKIEDLMMIWIIFILY